MSSPVLSTIDYTRKLILTTDASQDDLGVTLSQLDPEGKNRHVIAYMSQSLHPHERAYCITQREALCIVTAFKYFTTYLRFCEFEIRTDHRPQADWLSRDAFEAPTQEMKDQALNMSANELVREELECEDCMAELGGNKEPYLFSTAAADGQDDEVQDGPRPDVAPPLFAPERLGQTQGNQMAPPPENSDRPPTKKLGNYTIPFEILYKKMDTYHQDKFPRDKLIEMQAGDDFSGAMIRYLKNNETPANIKAAQRITVMAD